MDLCSLSAFRFQYTAARRRLVHHVRRKRLHGDSFNTQPPEGGWATNAASDIDGASVSTHSRPKAAGSTTVYVEFPFARFNTQPPEGGWACSKEPPKTVSVFQHTAARRRLGMLERTAKDRIRVSTHSRPKAAGSIGIAPKNPPTAFQHTAA